MDKEQLSLELECPVCFQTPRNPPIFQCENGHLICCACHPKMSNCPQGKCKFSGVRCRLAENILEKSNLPRPCKYSEGGCFFEDEILKLETHEAACDYRPVFCPEQECYEKPQERQVVDHLIKEHFMKESELDQNQELDECLWVIDDDDLRKRSIDASWPISPWKFKDTTFFSVLKKPHDDKLWYAWIYVLGSKDLSETFVSNIKLYSSIKGTSLTFRGKVHSLERGPKDIMQKSECLVFTDSQVRCLMSPIPGDRANFKDDLKHLLAIDYKVVQNVKPNKTK